MHFCRRRPCRLADPVHHPVHPSRLLARAREVGAHGGRAWLPRAGIRSYTERLRVCDPQLARPALVLPRVLDAV